MLIKIFEASHIIFCGETDVKQFLFSNRKGSPHKNGPDFFSSLTAHEKYNKILICVGLC